MLEISNLDVSYGKAKILTDINLNIENGELVSLIGANGAGKSTLLKAIVGILRPDSGDILFQDKKIQNESSSEIMKRGLVCIPEGREVFPGMTVEENLLLGAHTVDDSEEIQERLETVFELFPKIKERQSQKADSLSGGEQQMLNIGRGLMSKPRMVMFDEPSLGLAPQLVEKMFDSIRKIHKQENLTILLVEQNVRESLELTDRGYVLEEGQISLEGSSEELLNSEKIKKSYLGI